MSEELNDDLFDDEIEIETEVEGEIEAESEDDGHHGSEKEYSFEFSPDGLTVTAVFEVEDNGSLNLENISKHESYEVIQGDTLQVVRTETLPFGSEVTTYEDIDGDGYFERVAEQWVGSATPPTNNPVPALAHVLRFIHTDDDDLIAVRSDDVATGGLGADQFVIREAAELVIGDFDQNNDDKLVFDTGLGLAGKEQLQNHVTNVTQDGANLVVEFGSYATITLIGVTLSDIGWDDVVVLS